MDIKKICELGQNVIDIEAQMIQNLKSKITDDFAHACQILFNCKGRIIVVGVGKSGHICKKIAATMASTGSPAFFIHPSEAKHGDMGMITTNDVVLMLSNSGESEEIIALIPFIKRMGIPVITLTGKPQSTLAKSATVNIDVSVAREACPLGLAPTSSTTAALVMGDALAMTLLEMRGFTENDFARSHPGGSLGRRLLLRIDELMHQGDEMPRVSHHATLKDALLEMSQKKLGLTTVLDDHGNLLGIYTDGDVRRTFTQNVDLNSTKITDVMSKKPKMIQCGMLAADALQIMEAHKITALVVADSSERPVGIIHIHDILRAGVN